MTNDEIWQASTEELRIRLIDMQMHDMTTMHRTALRRYEGEMIAREILRRTTGPLCDRP